MFCEKLATLFAKMSNVRMCHTFYGYRSPHSEWEGLLALDIWYNLLYRSIDAEYPFDDSLLNMNPMTRRQVKNNEDSLGDYVTYRGRGKVYKERMPDDLEWMDNYSGHEYDGIPTICAPLNDIPTLCWDDVAGFMGVDLPVIRD